MLSPIESHDGDHHAVLDHLRRLVTERVRPLIPRDRPVALLDFPPSPNVGDSLIWVGTRAWLTEQGIRPCYVCSFATYSRDELARRIGNGTILLSGGGNFGDIYPPHQRLREAAVRDFPNNKIVQLPQSLCFEDPASLERASRTFNRHPDVTLLVRDQASLDTAREHFGATSTLCPDMALALPPMERAGPPAHEVVWLSRTDREGRSEPGPTAPAGVWRTDWPSVEQTPLRRLYRRFEHTLREQPHLHGLFYRPLTMTLDPLARERVQRGRRLLSAGRAVVTDRLHGHLLCMLLSIPHVLLDNTNNKVRGCYEGWTHPSPNVAWANSDAEAMRRAVHLAGGPPI